MAIELPETSTLHLFAQGAWDFLVAASALSVIAALISTAAEEFLRPRAQRRYVRRWMLRGPKPWLEYGPDGPLPPWEFFVDEVVGRFPSSFYALPPDQLCAQIIRRLQSSIERYDYRLGRGPPGPLKERPFESDGWMAWGDQLEGYVDELQSRLVQAALQRSYLTAAVGVILLGIILFGASAPYIDVEAARRASAPDVLQWVLLTLVFGVVAVLLSPIIQGAVTRLMRSR